MFSDAKDVMGLGGGPAQPKQKKPRANPRKIKKLPGVSREVAALMTWAGENEAQTTTLVPPVRPAEFKAKRAKNVHWKNLPIVSSGRRAVTGKNVDDLKVFHWVKVTNVPDYSFAQFSKPIKMLTYTDDEYDLLCASDPNWTRRQTDKLFALCRDFDLRFVVVHDRFAMPPPVPMPDADPDAAVDPLQQLPQSSAAAGSFTVNFSAVPGSVAPPTSATDASAALAGRRLAAARAQAALAAGTPAAAAASSSSSSSSSSSAAPAPAAAAAAAAAPMDTSGSMVDDSPATAYTAKPASAAAAVQAAAADIERMEEYLADTQKTVEDLKARFYTIQRALLQHRNGSDVELRRHPMFVNTFDPDHELERKDQLRRLYARSQQEVDEMGVIVLEHKRLGASIAKLKNKGAKPAPSKPAKPTAAAAPAAAAASSATAAAAAPKRGAQKAATPAPAAAAAAAPKRVGTAASAAAPSSAAAAAASSGAASGPANGMAPVPDSCLPRGIMKERPPGCFLRSSAFSYPLTITAKQQKQLDNELTTYGLKKATGRPFNVPTSDLCASYDALRADLVLLMRLQAHVQKREADLAALKSGKK